MGKHLKIHSCDQKKKRKKKKEISDGNLCKNICLPAILIINCKKGSLRKMPT